MSLASLIRRMGELGATPEMIAVAVEEIEADRVCLEARRAADRERKREQREREKSADVTGHGEHVTNRVSLDKEKSPEPPKEINPIPCVGVTRATPLFPPPPGVEVGQWRAFRQQRKKALTDRAYLMICNKLIALAEAGWPPGDMIDLAIERGWETVFEPKDQRHGQANRGSNGRMGGPRPDPTLALVRAAAAAQREDRGDYGEARPALPSR